MTRGSRTTDGLVSAGTLAVLTIVLQLWVAGAAAARADASQGTTTSIAHTLREVVEHAAPLMPKRSVSDTGETPDSAPRAESPNQPDTVLRSGHWLTTVPPPAAA